MPTFTFTSPDGKNFSVDGPEGSTKEQAFQILQQQQGKNPQPQSQQQPPEPPENKTLTEHAKDVAGAGALGAVAGVAAPYLLQGLGMAAEAGAAAFPPAAPALVPTGAALMGMATTMKAARLAEVASGAISGMVGESATKIAEASGAKQPGIIGIGAAMLSPGSSSLVKFVAGPLKPMWAAVQRLAGNAEAGIPAAVKYAEKQLRGLTESGQPQNAMHEMLLHGIEADRQAAEKAASEHVAEGFKRAADIAKTDEAAASHIISDAREHSNTIREDAAKRARVLEDATKGKLATAARVSALADKELKETVGLPQHESDIGNALRSKVTLEQQGQIVAKNEQYKRVVGQRDAAVALKEQSGIHVDSMPEMKELKAEISRKLLLTKPGQQAAKGKAEVTEQGVMSAYQKVYDAVSNRRVQTGMNEAGNPTYQTFKTTFEALDHVRRKLGDAAFGKEAEGYGALGQGIAKDLYSRISKIQEEFAGPAQKELQSGYSEALGGLKKYDTAAGKKITAVDRIDPETFTKDPKSIPGTFFKTQQGVKDLVELTGDKAFVTKTAHDFAAKKIDGMSAKQVTTWLKDNGDWMREIPGLQQKVAGYGERLAKIEKVGGKLESRAATTAKEAAATRPAGSKLADEHMTAAHEGAGKRSAQSADAKARVIKGAQKQGSVIKEEKFAPSAKLETILKSDEKPGAIRSLLLSGKPEQTRLAARHLAGTPGGQEQLQGSVRQVLGRMKESELTTTWNDRIKPMLKDGQMLPPKEYAKLESDVEGVLKAYRGKDKLSLVTRMIRSALVAGVAIGGVAGYERLRGDN